jgi:hypothetical protein
MKGIYLTIVLVIVIATMIIITIVNNNRNPNYLYNNTEKGVKNLNNDLFSIFYYSIFNIDKIVPNENVLMFNNDNTIIYIGFIASYDSIEKQTQLLRNKYKNIYIIILDFEPHDLKNTTPDMILSTKHEQKYFPSNIPVIYIPYFTYLFRENLNISHLKSLVKTPTTKFKKPVKTKFCAFITSNCDEKTYKGVKLRCDFFKLLNKRTNGRVDSLGKCYNNVKLKSKQSDNKTILKSYKFCICFENENRYNSEKMIYPIVADCIPIYYGSSIYKQFFNPKRIIDIDNFDNFDSCIDYILKVDSDDKLFFDIINEPFLKNNKIDKDLFSFSFGKGRCFKQTFDNLPSYLKKYMNFNSLYYENIHFITFADGKKYKSERVMKEAIDSNYFDVCKDMSNEINDFLNKHSSFIKNNKRGYGYWIWKHKVILDEYKNLSDNDILIWSDSGNTISKYNLKMIEYLNTLINGSGMLFFHVKGCKEGTWSKMDTVKHIFPDGNNDFINKILNDETTTASLMMFRKCKNTTLYLEEVGKHSIVYHLINDNTSLIPNMNGFKENRHDQTIFSLTKHKYKFDISHDNLDSRKKNCPFINSRKRL